MEFTDTQEQLLEALPKNGNPNIFQPNIHNFALQFLNVSKLRSPIYSKFESVMPSQSLD